MASSEQPRWTARVTYRIEVDEMVAFYHFEELDALRDLIEAGPDWNTIIKIEIILARVSHPGLTVEAASKL